MISGTYFIEHTAIQPVTLDSCLTYRKHQQHLFELKFLGCLISCQALITTNQIFSPSLLIIDIKQRKIQGNIVQTCDTHTYTKQIHTYTVFTTFSFTKPGTYFAPQRLWLHYFSSKKTLRQRHELPLFVKSI